MNMAVGGAPRRSGANRAATAPEWGTGLGDPVPNYLVVVGGAAEGGSSVALPSELPISEADFCTWVVERAQLHGWHVAHFRPSRTAKGWRTAMQGDVGFPDLVLARNGEVIIAELKTDTGQLSRAQRDWRSAIGRRYQVWRPKDRPAIEEALA